MIVKRRSMLALLLITVILLGGAAAYWYVNLPPKAPSGGPCDGTLCGTGLAWGSPTESTVDGFHLYNFTLASSGGGLTWSNLNFSFQANDGRVIPHTGTGWNITVFSLVGTTLASYSLGNANPTWVAGRGTPLSSQQTLLVTTPPVNPLSGDTLIISGVGSFQGSVSIMIP